MAHVRHLKYDGTLSWHFSMRCFGGDNRRGDLGVSYLERALTLPARARRR